VAQKDGDETRSADGARHAWVEALAVFRGSVDSLMLAAASVAPSDSPPHFEPDLGGPEDWSSSVAQEGPDPETITQQQQQQ